MALLRYPQKKIEDKDDWMKIDIYKYKPGSFGGSESGFSVGEGGAQGSVIQTILLPIPVNLPANTLMTPWGESKLNPLEAAGMNAAGTAINEGPMEGLNALAGTSAAALNALSSASGVKGATIALAAAAVKALGGNLTPQQALSRFAGITFNENVELTFNGVQLRGANTFEFTLTPRNAKEKNDIRNIIRVLKENMTPSKGVAGGVGGIFLNAPNVFQISYMKGKSQHPFLNKFKVTALQSLSVNFTPQNYATYEDGTPVSMILSLTFQELTPIYRDDYTSDSGTTVGY
jgi:methionine-rich copper-binding protein CopC